MPERELLVTGGEALTIVIVLALAIGAWIGAVYLDRRAEQDAESDRQLRAEARRHHPTSFDDADFWRDR